MVSSSSHPDAAVSNDAGSEETCAESGTTLDPALLTRTSWVDARTAVRHVNKGRATGNHWALWVRLRAHSHLSILGDFLHRSAGKVIFVGLLVLAAFCVGLKSVNMVTGLEELWVQEGGRLQRELNFVRTVMGEGWGTVSQSVIQTSRTFSEDGDGTRPSLLHPRAMLDHLDAMIAATSISLRMFDVTWRLKDLCYAPAAPPFGDEYVIEQIMENLFPCAIMTPLDCFWEGSKLLGPNHPVMIGSQQSLEWTSLNPQKLRMLKNSWPEFPFDALESFLKRSGITNGYQEKPCLDPFDPECPESAPNKKSKAPPNVGAELTGGCYGFATKYMHWPEQFVVGGTAKNRTGHIVRAEALQTTIQLMGERELFEQWSRHYKVHNIDWSVEKARQLIAAWQNKFAKAIEEHTNSLEAEVDESGKRGQNVPRLLVFSQCTLDMLLSKMSELSIMRAAVGIGIVTVYGILVVSRFGSCLCFPARRPGLAHSHQWGRRGFVAAAGVLLTAFTVAAGLGLAALIGINFNATSTQVVPFLAVGLGAGDVFILFRVFGEVTRTSMPENQKLGAALKRSGLTIMIGAVQTIGSFLAAAIIPLPVLRAFCLQSALLIALTTVSTLLLFSAVASVVLFRRRRHEQRCDADLGEDGVDGCNVLLSCCFPSGVARGGHRVYAAGGVGDDEHGLDRQLKYGDGRDAYLAPPTYRETVAKVEGGQVRSATVTALASDFQDVGARNVTEEDANKEALCGARRGPTGVDFDSTMRAWSLSQLMKNFYVPFVLKAPVKGLTLLCAVCAASAGLWGMLRMREGLNLTDIVPKHTPEHAFLEAQTKYFGFFHIHAVTGGEFEYPGEKQQLLLHEFHDAFVQVSAIIKNDDGGLPPFWLSMFRDWLKSLQNAFDADWAAGHITQESWNANASAEGILAYKLLVQTGHVDDPVDKSQVTTARLVDERGVIRSTGFYNYLSAWVSNDALAYSYSDGALSPSPRVWYHDPYDTELKIPKSNSLDMSLMPFQLVALDSTEALTDTVGQIRAICDSFRARGLPTFPAGIPFTFWEQYTGLRPQMAASMGAAAACVFVTIAVGLGSPWAGLLTAASVALTVLCLWGTMSMLLGLQLSAVPAALLVCSVGLVARPAVQVLAAHASAIGGRARRTAIALDAVGPAVVHAHLAVLCGAAMLALAPFDFIVRHFFCVIVVLVMLSLLHSLLLLPVLLTLAGPPAEVSPVDGTCLLPYPSPDLRRPQERAPAGYHKSSAVPGRSMRVVAPPGGLRRGGNLYPPPPPGMREERQRSGSSRMSKRAAAAAAAAAATRGSQISLSTITEEPSSLTSSHEIVLQPELVLETSLNGPLTASTSSSSSAASSSCASSSSADDCCGKRLEDVSPAASVSSGVHFTTRVTATAKFKVELHSRPGCVTASSTTSSSKRRSRTSGIERVSISQPTSTSSSVSSTRSECESSFDPYMSSSSSPSPPPYRRSNDGV